MLALQPSRQVPSPQLMGQQQMGRLLQGSGKKYRLARQVLLTRPLRGGVEPTEQRHHKKAPRGCAELQFDSRERAWILGRRRCYQGVCR